MVKKRLLLCRSALRGAKKQAIFNGAEEKFLESLEKLSIRINKGGLKIAQIIFELFFFEKKKLLKKPAKTSNHSSKLNPRLRGPGIM